jgi:hypothetical protein
MHNLLFNVTEKKDGSEASISVAFSNAITPQEGIDALALMFETEVLSAVIKCSSKRTKITITTRNMERVKIFRGNLMNFWLTRSGLGTVNYN